MAIPVAAKNQIKSEIISCIVEDGKDAQECLMKAQKMHGMTKKDTNDIAREIASEAGEEE